MQIHICKVFGCHLPRRIDYNGKTCYLCTNSTRHATRKISVPGRVLFFYGIPNKIMIPHQGEHSLTLMGYFF